MKVDVLNIKGEKIETTDLAPAIFEAPIKPDLMHQALVRQLANARRGTQSVKNRSEVSGGGRKPWRQKGTGRARAGSTRISQFRGGGVTFGPTPRDHGIKLQKKVRRLALKTALSAKQAEGKLVILDRAAMDEGKTKILASALNTLGFQSVLFIDGPELDENFVRAASNIVGIDVLPQQGANVYDILRRDVLVLTKDAVSHLEARLK
jgi:large subunit ribosomal protein L4